MQLRERPDSTMPLCPIHSDSAPGLRIMRGQRYKVAGATKGLLRLERTLSMSGRKFPNDGKQIPLRRTATEVRWRPEVAQSAR